MANVWKVGSRWSEYGTSDSSIISIFRRNNIIFVGAEKVRDKFVRNVKIGDYFAIADGYNVVAVAKAIDSPTLLKNLKVNTVGYESDRFDYEDCKDWVIGVRVKIIDLAIDDRIWYKKRITFCSANQIWQKVIDLYENQYNKFSIDSYTCTLFKTDGNYKSIFDNQTRYIVPIFQRPYSWSVKEIKPFISDLINAYLGKDRKATNSEPMFIGTMQLSEKKYIDKHEYEQEIIDGQQRITTLTILLKLFSLKYPYKKLKNLNFNWLETRVNKKQNDFMSEFFIIKEVDDIVENENNKYITNCLLIQNIFNELIDNEPNFELDIEHLCNYLFTKIYFVVIETFAGLSKTLQIFNSINTTGLDLNGGDIFKIRMYEYLTDLKGQDENVFEEISQVYLQIDILNNLYGKETDITGILSLYQYILISKYDLPTVLYDYGQEKFFDELFDCLLGIQQHKNFVNARSVELSLDEIKRLVTIRYSWISGFYVDPNLKELYTTEDYCLSHQIGWSRYSRYWNLRFLFAYQYPNDIEKLPQFMRLISKYLIIYSMLFEKTVYHAHSIIRKLMLEMFREGSTVQEIIVFMENEIQKEVPMRGNPKDALNNVLNSNIVYSDKKKNIVYRLSAMFDEDGLDSSSLEKIKPIIRKLYNSSIDIEHIHASADDTHKIDDNLQNSIGNLVILEYDLNRSLGKKTYSEKRNEYIKRSQFASVLRIAENHEEWGEEQIKNRRDVEIVKLLNYIFYKKKTKLNGLLVF